MSKTVYDRHVYQFSDGMIHIYTFVIIVDGFQKVLYCACAIKIPAISQFSSLYVCYLMLILVNIVGGFEDSYITLK